MDYITKGILDNIKFIRRKNSNGIYSIIAEYYRMLFEYHLTLMFACLWDRKEFKISVKERKEIMKAMSKPILGTTLTFIMHLDSVGESVFNLTKEYEELLRKFINARNATFGHQIIIPNIQEESYKKFCVNMESNYTQLAEFEKKYWGEECEFRLRQDPVETAQIIIFNSNRNTDYRDVEKNVASSYIQDELYFSCEVGSFKISPFIISVERNGINYDLYYFINYKLQSGKFNYALVSEIDDEHEYSKIFPNFFTSYIQTGQYTIRRANGVVSNKFENNYDYFVNIAPFTKYVTQIWEFLVNNKSTTCLTIRGAGGIGKTALVQYICTKLLFETITDSPAFNFVIFCSAKDREFKLDTMRERGRIYSIDKNKIIDSYQEILRTVCRVLEINLEPDTEENITEIENTILNESNVLFIIDDFETLKDTEKEKIVKLINRMQIGRHKVLITTRSQYLVGSTYDVERMNEEQVIAFMKERFANITNPNSDVKEKFQKLLSTKEARAKIYEITMGLPLLTIQLATLMPLKGFTENLLSRKFFNDAEDFLLGRLYSCLSTPTAKLLFLIIAAFFENGLKNIPYLQLKNFYVLHCQRLDILDIDFENDLKELKRWNIIKIEDDFIPVSNQISQKIFLQCTESFLDEYSNKNFFDDRLFKFTVSKGIHKGILKYFELQDAFIDDFLVNIFVLENFGNFTNEERLIMLKKFITPYENSGNKEKLQDLYNQWKIYFENYSGYVNLFKDYPFSSSVNVASQNPVPTSYNTFENLNKKLEEIKNVMEQIQTEKRSHTYKTEQIRKFRVELKNLHNLELKNALENFSIQDLSSAQDTAILFQKVGEILMVNYANYENYQLLVELIEKN